MRQCSGCGLRSCDGRCYDDPPTEQRRQPSQAEKYRAAPKLGDRK